MNDGGMGCSLAVFGVDVGLRLDQKAANVEMPLDSRQYQGGALADAKRNE
jgi:hypothetical protein